MVSTCILIAHVNPSQSSPDKAHCAWIGIRQDGEIITAHCTCMAGYVSLLNFNDYYYNFSLGERCSHSAAILFKVECAVRNGHTAVTSSLCGWNQIFSNKVI